MEYYKKCGLLANNRIINEFKEGDLQKRKNNEKITFAKVLRAKT